MGSFHLHRLLCSYCHSDAERSGGRGTCFFGANSTNPSDFMYTVPKLTDYSTNALQKASLQARSAFQQELLEQSLETRKAFRDRWVARKNGLLTQINDLWLKAAPKEAKRTVGQLVNELKQFIEQEIAKAQELVEGGARQRSVAVERVDITLPGVRRALGAEHPVIRTMNEIVGVFRNLGYSVSEGPEVETDYYNFEALNFPPNHPARDMQDTLFLAGQDKKAQRERLLLRTHTS